MRKAVTFFISLVFLVSCCGKSGDNKTSTQWGDSIATIDNTVYYWLQLADDFLRYTRLFWELLIVSQPRTISEEPMILLVFPQSKIIS